MSANIILLLPKIFVKSFLAIAIDKC